MGSSRVERLMLSTDTKSLNTSTGIGYRYCIELVPVHCSKPSCPALGFGMFKCWVTVSQLEYWYLMGSFGNFAAMVIHIIPKPTSTALYGV